MYETVAPAGHTVHSTVPFHPETIKDRNPVVFVLWSWGFTVRNTVKGLTGKGQW